MEINDISTFLDYFNKIHKRSLAVMKAIPTESFNKKLSPTSLSLAELIIQKQRHGPTGNVMLEFEAMFTKFKDTQNS